MVVLSRGRIMLLIFFAATTKLSCTMMRLLWPSSPPAAATYGIAMSGWPSQRRQVAVVGKKVATGR
jgi:hypothetical protein